MSDRANEPRPPLTYILQCAPRPPSPTPPPPPPPGGGGTHAYSASFVIVVRQVSKAKTASAKKRWLLDLNGVVTRASLHRSDLRCLHDISSCYRYRKIFYNHYTIATIIIGGKGKS